MENKLNTTSLSMHELATVNGRGTSRIIIPYDAPLLFLIKWIYEFSRDAA